MFNPRSKLVKIQQYIETENEVYVGPSLGLLNVLGHSNVKRENDKGEKPQDSCQLGMQAWHGTKRPRIHAVKDSTQTRPSNNNKPFTRDFAVGRTYQKWRKLEN